MFLPAVGLNHISGRGKGHGYGCKAGFDRQSNDAGHRCDESASSPQKVFFLFLFNSQLGYLPLGLGRFPMNGNAQMFLISPRKEPHPSPFILNH